MILPTMPIERKKCGLAPEFVIPLDLIPAFHFGHSLPDLGDVVLVFWVLRHKALLSNKSALPVLVRL